MGEKVVAPTSSTVENDQRPVQTALERRDYYLECRSAAMTEIIDAVAGCASAEPPLMSSEREREVREMLRWTSEPGTMTVDEAYWTWKKYYPDHFDVEGTAVYRDAFVRAAPPKISGMSWNSRLAKSFIMVGNYQAVFGKTPLFTDLDYKTLIEDLCDEGFETLCTDPRVADAINRFVPSEYHTSLCLRIIESVGGDEYASVYSFASVIDQLKGITLSDHDTIVDALITANTSCDNLATIITYLGTTLSGTTEPMRRHIVDLLFDLYPHLCPLSTLLEHLDEIPFLERDTLAEWAIQAKNFSSLVNHIDAFPDLDHDELALTIIAETPPMWDHYISKLGPLGLRVVERILTDVPGAHVVLLAYLDQFPVVAHQMIYDTLSQTTLGRETLVEHAKRLTIDIPVSFFSECMRDMGETDILTEHQLGEIAKRRKMLGIDRKLHDTWLLADSFKVPELAPDIATLRNSEFHLEEDRDLPECRLWSLQAELDLVSALLAMDEHTRQRLTLGGIEDGVKASERIKQLSKDSRFSQKFHAELGRRQAAVTREYYDELLTHSWISREWNKSECDSSKKFFHGLFAQHPELKDELAMRISRMRTDLEQEYVAEQDDETSQTSVAGEMWFYTGAGKEIYATVMARDEDGVPFYKSAEFYLDELCRRLSMIGDSEPNDAEAEHFRSLLGKIDFPPLAMTIQKLETMRRDRERYIHDARTWLTRHQTNKQREIERAWRSRPRALADGTPDSVSHILRWVRDTEFQRAVDGLAERDELLSDANEPVRSELLRVMKSVDAARAMIKLKKWREARRSDDQRLPAVRKSIEMNDTHYTFEVLDKNDPRGFTIGEDTDCCMTLGGMSESCIKAGYTQEYAGFIALYRDGSLIAQSFWYVHPFEPSTLVIDNIEANKGRNMGAIIPVYQQALRAILKDHPDTYIERVTIGGRYNDVDIKGLEKTTPAPLLDGVYTDARNQRLLLTV